MSIKISNDKNHGWLIFTGSYRYTYAFDMADNISNGMREYILQHNIIIIIKIILLRKVSVFIYLFFCLPFVPSRRYRYPACYSTTQQVITSCEIRSRVNHIENEQKYTPTRQIILIMAQQHVECGSGLRDSWYTSAENVSSFAVDRSQSTAAAAFMTDSGVARRPSLSQE